MSNLISIFIGLALINNFVVARFLGLCPFFGVSKKLENALMMGIAVTIVMVLASIVTWFLLYGILKPYDIEYMNNTLYILVIAALVQIVEMWIKRTNVPVYNAFGIYLPLITTNCAVLGITFINATEAYDLIESVVAASGGGVGFTLVLAMMSGIRERIELADVPRCFRGMPVAFLVAMILGLLFFGFKGMV
ncbi:MAG: electron transport complex subunit RsxA [Thermoplasmata archaeon]|nr:electron transport complex subunit RsxA [Thermoplasmata archaeon]